MDRLLPTMEFKDSAGLPSYPPSTEREILRPFMAGKDPTDEMEPLLDAWIWARAAVIREAKGKYPRDQQKVARAMGWRLRKDSKKQERHSHEDTRSNGQDTSVGTLEAGAEGREGLQGPVSDHR